MCHHPNLLFQARFNVGHLLDLSPLSLLPNDDTFSTLASLIFPSKAQDYIDHFLFKLLRLSADETYTRL